jgi:hypothetical protein
MGLDYNYPVINWKADFIFLETVNNVDPREMHTVRFKDFTVAIVDRRILQGYFISFNYR